jgi:hypothetical protein
MKKTLLIALMIVVSNAIKAQYSDSKQFNTQDLIYDTIDGYDLVYFEGCSFTNEIGAPKLPIIKVKYLIPVNAEVTGITINNFTDEIVSGNYNIYPAQPKYLPNGMEPPDFVEPNPDIYNNSVPYPGIQVDIIDDGFMMAYHIISINIFPLEYIPNQQQLKLYSNIDFTIEYTEGECLIQLPKRISQYRNELTEGFIKNQIENPDDFLTTAGGPLNVVNNNSGDKSLNMDFIPSLYGDIPDYIIITNELLKPEFEVLAEWKTKKGIPTLIITTEDICNEYTGVDKAEQIRKYLIDAYMQWGPSLFILLGGDVDIIPARYGYPTAYGLKVTDLYYATVEGNWNDDGDYLWGETYDINQIEVKEYDTGPDLFIGRAPVDNIDQAVNFVNKVISYEKLNNLTENFDYVMNYLTTNFHNDRHQDQKYIWDIIMNQQTNPWFQLKNYPPGNDSPLYDYYEQGLVEEFTHNNFLTALNNGGNSGYDHFHLVLHSDHSGPTSLGANDASVLTSEIDALSNSPYQQVMISTGCDPNEFQYEDCIAEH